MILATIGHGVWMRLTLRDREPWSAHRAAQAWCRSLRRVCGVRVHVEGRENLPTGGSYVFVSNHRSNVDIPVLLPILPYPVRFFAKSALFKVPFLGWGLRNGGHFVVDYDSAKNSLRSMLDAAKRMREENISAFVFPEGGRTDGDMGPFREGAAFLALKTGVPVVPMAISGSRRVLPPRSLHIVPGEVRVRIGEKIPVDGLGPRDRAELTARLETAVAALAAD